MTTKLSTINFQKTYLFLLLIVLSFFFLLIPKAVSAQTNSITITSPNGGETYTVGQNVEITWTTESTQPCSIYYQTPEGGSSTSYYVGGVNDASVGSFNWTASVPSGITGDQLEKIQMVCWGMPVEYSDNYFTVTQTPAPVCDRAVQLSLVNSSQSAYRSETVNNTLSVTNPNDPACGPKLYGLSRSYPFGWTMDLPYSVNVNPGTTENVPFSLNVASDAPYQDHAYSIYAGGSEGGVLVGVNGTVTVNPRCDLPVQASLTYSSQDSYAGDTLSNNLVLTNPNIVECSPKTYIYSRGYPGGWDLSIQPNVTVNSGQTVQVPFTLTSVQTAAVGTHNYDFLVYNSWADGSGQTPVAGVVNIREHIAPTVSITSPANNARVNRNKSLTVNALASDNVGVTKVEFYVNNVLTCTDTESSYSCTFTTPNQSGVSLNIVAKAYDAANNTSTHTITVTTK